MSQSDKEPFSLDFKYEMVVQSLKDLALGDLIYDYDRIQQDDHSKEFLDQLAAIMGRIHSRTSVFFEPTMKTEARDVLIPQLFSDLVYVKSIAILTRPVDRDSIQTGIARIETQQQALSELMKEILIVLNQVLEKVDALDTK